MYLVKLIFYMLSPILFLIILLINPLIKFRFISMPSDRLGEFATCFQLYFIKKLKKTDHFDIFFTQKIVSNNFYLKLIKKKIFVIDGIFVFPIFRIFSVLSLKFSFFKRFILNPFEEDKIFGNMKLDYDDKKIISEIPKKFIDEGESFLKNLGITKSDNIILLYVRDAAYLKETFPNIDYSYHDYRNSDIENYIHAVNYAIERGYYVFRMGAIVEKQLNIKNKKFIDYSNLYRNDFLDIFLAYRCSFVIGTPAGYDAIPYLSFKKPILTTNGCPALPLILSPRSNMIYSLKHYHCKIEKRNLTIKEMLERNLVNMNGPDLLKNNITLHENSPEDLKVMVNEFLDQFEGKLDFSKEKIELRNIFNKTVFDYLVNTKDRRFYEENLLNKKNQYRFRSKISINFLKSNSYLIDN